MGAPLSIELLAHRTRTHPFECTTGIYFCGCLVDCSPLSTSKTRDRTPSVSSKCATYRLERRNILLANSCLICGCRRAPASAAHANSSRQLLLRSAINSHRLSTYAHVVPLQFHRFQRRCSCLFSCHSILILTCFRFAIFTSHMSVSSVCS